ncbi:hypothetical protein PPACK8108_LOCUS9984 [Phakopsora pachyrhizi]|uniref:Peptidase A2 domain-containing protein n=1 Tax=Phakopsora pachyrhizi TaxID=170000 RepID=A0AAV0B0E0_PHAPC|nr:hypothetical protein PPACK8108_LOCUS9984 [Phakopsora pachyrhizi]
MSGLGGTKAGPPGPSRSEATSRKVVKIPKEEESMFDGKAENEGAEDYDKVKQVICFCKGRDLKEEVMKMEGWRELDWGKLVKEMKARWGLKCQPQEKKGGVSSKGFYEEFSYFFYTRLKALFKELQEMVKVKLIKGKKMVENRSGGYSLPTPKVLKLAVDAEMKFKGEVSVEGSVYYRPFQGENEIMREEEESKKEEEKKKEPEAADHLAKKLDQMTDILKSFIGQTVERIILPDSSGSFVCYYCGMQGHASTRFPRLEEDIKNGLVRRDVTAEGRPANYLPDNTRVHYDRTRTFRSVVEAHSSKVPLEKFTTQVAELSQGSKEGAVEPVPSRKREKATTVPGEEGVLQRIADEIGEEEEDYEEIQQEQEGGKDEAVLNMKLNPREQERFLKARKRAATLLKEGPRHLESQLQREYPGAINRTLKTILDTEVTQRLGDLLLTSSGVAEGLKRQMTRKRDTSGADSDVEDPRFCTPLGFLEVTVGKHRTKGLVDSGSMTNVIPEELARKWGLAMVGSEMKLRGVGGHLTSLVGVMGITGVTFCVAKGVKHLIQGRPFLMDLEARLDYGETGEVMSYVMRDRRWLPLYVPEGSSKFQILSRKEEGVRSIKK